MPIDEIQKYFESGDYKAALRAIDKLSDPKDVFKGLIYKCRILIVEGNYDQVHQILDEISYHAHSDMTHQKLQVIIMRIAILLRTGKASDCPFFIQEAQILINGLEHNSDKSQHLMAEFYHTVGNYYGQTGQDEKSMSNYNEALRIRRNLGNHRLIAQSMHNLANSYQALGDLETARSYFIDCLELFIEVDNKLGIASCYNNLGNIYKTQGKYDLALINYKTGISIARNLDFKQYIAGSLNNMGEIFAKIGKLQDALLHFKQSLKLRKELGNAHDVGISYIDIGTVYLQLGELNKSQINIEFALSLFREIGHDPYTANALLILGDILLLRGDLDLALDYLNESLHLRKLVGNEVLVADSLERVARVYSRMNKLQIATEYLERALRIRKSQKNPVELARVLYYYVKTNVDHDTNTELEIALNELERLLEIYPYDYIRLFHSISKAIISDRSPRIKDKALAQEIYEKIYQTDPIDSEIRHLAMLKLCEILMFDLKSTGSNKILLEINEIINNLLISAESQNSYSLLSEIYLLQSKLEVINLDIPRARQLINKSEEIALEKGMLKLAIDISRHHDLMLQKMSILEDLSVSDMNIQQKLDVLEIEEYISLIIKDMIKDDAIKEEEPISFLALAPNYQIIYQEGLVEEMILGTKLLELVTRMLTDYIGSVDDDINSINRLSLDQYTLVFSVFRGYIFCYIFKGLSFTAINKFSSIIDLVQAVPQTWEIEEPELRQEKIIEHVRRLVNDVFPHLYSDNTLMSESNPTSREFILPLELSEYSILFHPIRLAIVKVLFFSYRTARSDLLKLLAINSGALDNHVKRLSDAEVLEIASEFVNNRPRKILYLNQQGYHLYQQFKELVLKVIN